MKIVLCVVFLLCFLTGYNQRIHYVFAAPNAVHHEAEISISADNLPAGDTYFRMSRSSPGRYARHEFGKNVYNVKAYDLSGKALKVEKADADVYKVSGHKGSLKLTYTLFANYADGTYANIDATGYHLNMPATFMWIKGMDNAPITIQFIPVEKNWKVATQLKPTADSFTFTAPGLQYFMDSPTKIGNLQFRQWTETNSDHKTYNFRLALEGDAPADKLDSFTANLKKVVHQARAVYGEYPSYDYATYTFIASINPYVNSDGMEHRNSTMISVPVKFENANELLEVFSHEFFHCWNVERIRPYQLEPFNFEKSNMSEALWVAEGFTQYYGNLLLMRSGLSPEADFFGTMSDLVNAKMNKPGGREYSPIENSQRAVFVDAGVAIDRTNYANMYSSYYTYGGAIAMALDLSLRTDFNNLSLDDLMRTMWRRHGKTEKPYTVADVQTALKLITNESYASAFFKKYVYGHEAFDFNRALSPAGLVLAPVNKGKAWIGPVSFVEDRPDLMVASNTIKNTPLYNAKVDIDDILVSLDGKNLTEAKDLDAVLASHAPGDKLSLVYKHHDEAITSTLELMEDNTVVIRPLETLKLDEKAEAFRKAWMGERPASPIKQ